jgi:hypothetical protein
VATVLTVAPAQASTMAAHERLADMLKRVGVSITLNPPECKMASYAGYYRDAVKKIVICQTHGVDGTYEQAGWTANDLDTLRHEAHHVTQSCAAGGIANSTLGRVYAKPFLFARQFFPTHRINNIVSVYKDRGASDHVAVLEVEAFAVAEMNNPDQQVADLRKFCFYL